MSMKINVQNYISANTPESIKVAALYHQRRAAKLYAEAMLFRDTEDKAYRSPSLSCILQKDAATEATIARLLITNCAE